MSRDNKQPEVLMYTQAFCGYCAAARELLKQKGIEYKEIDVTMNAGLRRKMTELTGRNTVPQIFIGEQHIGGYDDMASLDQNNELDELLGLSS